MEGWLDVTGGGGGTELMGEKSVTVPLSPPQFAPALICNATPRFSVEGRRLIA
jgi:hypothetical protein